MPDWEQSVRERLRAAYAAAHEHVVRELAGHLEEVYEELIRRGESPALAEQLVLTQVSDWHRLQRQLERAREGDSVRNQQIRAVWLPGLLTTIAAFGLLRAILAFGALPWWILQGRLSDVIPALGRETWLFVIPWLLVLPLAGAAGSFASWRAGGRPAQRVLAALFPTIVIAGLAAIFLFGNVLQSSMPGDAISSHFFMAMIPWVLLPSLSLLLGALPFARLSSLTPHPA